MNSVEQAIAVSALRMHPPFRQTSRRLLADLIEGSAIFPLTSSEFLDEDLGEGRLVVLAGTLIATRKHTDKATEFSVKDEGRVFAIGEGDVDKDGKLLWSFRAATEVGHCRILYVADEHIRRILHASPLLAFALGEEEANRLARGKWSPLNQTLVCAAPGMSVPLEALTFLLAAAVKQTRTPEAGENPATTVTKTDRRPAPADKVSKEAAAATPDAESAAKRKTVAVIRCSDPLVGWVLVGDKFEQITETEKLTAWLEATTLVEDRRKPSSSEEIGDSVEERKAEDEPVFPSLDGHVLTHAFFVDEERPIELSKEFRRRKFHQIVYIAEDTVREIPFGLERRIFEFDRLRDGDRAGFNAFVPTVLVDAPGTEVPATRSTPKHKIGTAPTMPPGRLSPRTKRARRYDFAVAEAAPREDAREEARSEPGWSSLERDSCTLRFDFTAIEARWDAVEAARTKAKAAATTDVVARIADVVAGLKRENGCTWESALRWARAVTNCQVGVVLSGGGASAFRAYALLQALEMSGVPVDVIGGVSGGTLVAAYYAKSRMKGFDLCFANAGKFQRAGLLSAITSRFIQDQVDRDLGATRVEDLEIRLAAVAGASPEDDAPRGVVITHGTLGEAVRASGSLPLAYGPTLKGGYRYADGATASPVPVDVVRNLGADVTIAFNCIPGPDRGNPFNDSAAGTFLYRHTVAGRLIDAWVAMAFLLQQSSRLAMATADVRFEPKATRRPLLEMLDWTGIRKIARRSWEEDREEIQLRVNDLEKLWKGLRTGVSADGLLRDSKGPPRPRGRSGGGTK